ncbi:MAG: DUF6197 family protein [Oryzihumus sp.]
MTIIRKALDRLRSDGWGKGAFATDDGRCCILGALYTEAHITEGVDVREPQHLFAQDHSPLCASQGDPDEEPCTCPRTIVTIGTRTAQGAADLIEKVICDQHPEESQGYASATIPAFNDAAGRSFEEVERVLEKAALLEEE